MPDFETTVFFFFLKVAIFKNCILLQNMLYISIATLNCIFPDIETKY